MQLVENRVSTGGIMSRKIIAVILVSGFILGLSSMAMAADPEIVGTPKCMTCHKAKTGDQYKIWSESKHAGAFATLASDESKKIAADLGLGDPQKEEACLKCHATKAFLGAAVDAKGKYTDEEGVGCESCHGAGSLYRTKHKKDPDLAKAELGLIVNLDAAACEKCHNEESPTFKGFDLEKRWAEIAHPRPEK
jgi:hypothetical protein